MADGTVTGEFRLYTVQARRELERLQREGKATDREMEKLGRDLDTVGSRKQQTQIRTTTTEVRRLGTTSRSSSRGVRSLQQEVARLALAIERANFGDRRGGGAAAAAAGAGVRGGAFGLSGGIKLMGAQAAIALPLIRSLVGAVGALGAAATSAAGGAGAVGVAGIGGLTVGLAGILSIAKPVATEIGRIADAQKRYNDVLRQYGRGSDQAGTARRELRTARRQGPRGSGALVSEAFAFQRAWNRATQKGQEDLVAFYREVVRTGRRLEKPLADIANMVTAAFTGEGRKGLKFLESRRVQRGLRAGAGIFSENLGNVRRIGQATVKMFLDITRAARPYVKEFSDFLAKWFERGANRTRNIRELRRNIGDMVDDLKAVGRLGGAGVRLLLALVRGGRPAGRGLLESMTDQLNEWTDWLNRNPQKVRAFFREAADSARTVAGAVRDITGALIDLSGHLQGVITLFGGLGTVVSTLGGTGSVLSGAALLGAFRGRGRGRGRGPGRGRGRGGGGFTKGSPLAGAGAKGVGRYVRGAGRAAWPVAATFAGLDFLGTEGSFERRMQGVLAGADPFGLVAEPQSFSGLRDQGQTRVAGLLERAGSDPRALSVARRERARLQGRLGETRRTRSGFRGHGGRTTSVLSEEQREKAREEIKALTDAINQLTPVVQANTLARSEGRGGTAATSVQKAYELRLKRFGPARAAAGIRHDTLIEMSKAKTPERKEALAEGVLGWLNTAKKDSPKLEKVYDSLSTAVEKRFKKMDDRVTVVDGTLVRKVGKKWERIRRSITTPLENARSEGGAALSALEQDAIDQLVEMGYPKSQATRIVRGVRGGGGRNLPGSAANPAAATVTAPGAVRTDPSPHKRARAHGGRLRGRGLYDTVPMIDGGMAAPGELVVNRHTEASHDADARRAGLPTLSQRVAQERRPHHAPMRATGGMVQSRAKQLSGGLMGANSGLAPYASLGASYGLSVSSGLRPGAITSYGNVSLHASGDAIDMSGPAGPMLQFAQAMAQQHGSGLDELIHTPLGFGIKNGRQVAPYAVADHYDHVHVGDRSPGSGGMMLGPFGIGATGGISLTAPGSRLGGVPGALSNAMGRAYATGLEQMVNSRIGAGSITAGGVTGAGGQYNKSSLVNLWTMAGGDPGVANLMAAIALAESGGNPSAHNPSGASGLWQILGNPFPGNPMDPATNARMAVSKYKSQGLGAWEAYTRGMHTKYLARGGRIGGGFRGWGGSSVHGAGVGDGVGLEQMTAGGHGGGGGGRPIMVNISMGSVKVGSVEEAGGVGEAIGRQVAAKIAQALRAAPVGA